MEEEKNICFDLFLKAYGTQPNFKIINNITLINQEILIEFFEEYKKMPLNIPNVIEDLREEIYEMIDSEMKLEEIILHLEECQ